MKKSTPNNRAPQNRAQLSGNEKIAYRTARRRKKNKLKALVIRSALALVILCAGVFLVIGIFFRIDSVTVTGESRYSAEEVIAASGVSNGDNLIFKSESSAAELITKELPYIGSVKFKRRLPSTLEIEITATEPYYAVAENGYYTLLNSDCKVLEKNIEYIGENIILLKNGENANAVEGETMDFGDSQVIEKLAQLHEALAAAQLEDITEIDISDIYNIKLVYQGRITLELGETGSEVFLKKLQLGKAAIDRQNLESDRYRGTINLTVEGKGYWQEETASASGETEPQSGETESAENEAESKPQSGEEGESEPASQQSPQDSG